MLDRFMETFAKEMELEAFPNVKGSYIIPLENDLSIQLVPLPNGFSLFSTTASVPTVNRETFLVQVLHANLFGQGTHGSVLGLNDLGNLLTLSRIIDYNIDYKTFRDIIEDFINVLDFWREEVRLSNK